MLDVARRLFASLDRLLHCVLRQPMESKQIRIADTRAESELKSKCRERARAEMMQNRYTNAIAGMLNSRRRLTLTGAGGLTVRRAIIWGLEKIASFAFRGVWGPHTGACVERYPGLWRKSGSSISRRRRISCVG